MYRIGRLSNLVSTHKLEVEELEDGYAFAFPDESKWRRLLPEFCELFPLFNKKITAEVTTDQEQQRIWLRFQGPDGTKPYVATLFLSGHVYPSRWQAMVSTRFREWTSPLRVLPDFLVIGAARSGTTSLYRYLVQHPAIAPPLKKEIFYFDRSFDRSLLRYRVNFPLATERAFAKYVRRRPWATCEATPCYLFHPHAPKRIRQTMPDAKLICLLRSPVDRAYSHYKWMARAGRESLSFEEALEAEETRLGGEFEKVLADEHYYSPDRQAYSYRARGEYADQLERWLECFPREQLLILKSEAVFERPEEHLPRILDFLGLPADGGIEYSRENAVAPAHGMDAETRSRLTRYFAPLNERLSQLVGIDFGWDRAAGRSDPRG
jgi:hypothetical protein